MPANLVMAPTVYGPSVEFREILRRRRMHRAFLPEPISREQVERIAGVIRRAPSGGFSQGGSIVVVTDEDVKRTLIERFEMTGTYADDAPVLMVLSANEALYHARYNEADKLAVTGGVEVTWPVPYWFVDAGALMALVLMAAIDEGLAGAFVGHPDQKRICDEVLGLPEEVVPIGLALIGKPGEAPEIGSRLKSRQRPADDLVHWQRW
jgi:nitroreductase